MPSSCPKCHRVLEEDEICCAQVLYTWRCKSCHKLTTGIAIPYGKCFLCGGDLEVIEDRNLGDPLHLRAIREALQFELNSFHFYKLARERVSQPAQRMVLEHLFEAELDHLHELEEKYHAHLDASVVDLSPSAEKLLNDSLFSGISFNDDTSIQAIYEAAIAMERRTRDYFRKTAEEMPAGLEKELYQELAAEEEEHIAMLETAIA